MDELKEKMEISSAQLINGVLIEEWRLMTEQERSSIRAGVENDRQKKAVKKPKGLKRPVESVQIFDEDDRTTDTYIRAMKNIDQKKLAETEKKFPRSKR